MKVALIIVDMQNDFMDDGALPVKGARAIIPQVVKTIGHMLAHDAAIITTQDWHPVDHSQLQPNGGPWPVHCIEGSDGADLVTELKQALPADHMYILKGDEKDKDGYSGFEGFAFIDGPGEIPLNDLLHTLGITHVYVCGVATDYCVKATAIDAAKAGYVTAVVTNAIAGVEVNPGDIVAAMKEMTDAGVLSLTF